MWLQNLELWVAVKRIQTSVHLFGRIFSHSEMFEIRTVCLMLSEDLGIEYRVCFYVSFTESNFQGNCSLCVANSKCSIFWTTVMALRSDNFSKGIQSFWKTKAIKESEALLLQIVWRQYSIQLQTKLKLCYMLCSLQFSRATVNFIKYINMDQWYTYLLIFTKRSICVRYYSKTLHELI